jgi:hypothetical protein
MRLENWFEPSIAHPSTRKSEAVLRLEDGLASVPTRPLTLPVTRRRMPFWGDAKGEPLVARSSVSHPTALRPLVAAVVAFLCVFACASFPVAASAAPARVLHVPVDSRLFLPCANDGAGEVVHFTGMILGVSSGTFDGAGGLHSISVEVEQGVQGVGETTGRRYVEHFVNLSFNTTGSGGFPLVSTQQEIYRVNSAGPGFDSTIRIRNHTTINANGETTVSFDDATMECLAESP